MAKETDYWTGTVSTVKSFEAKTFPTAFSAAPNALIYSGTYEVKKKAGIDNLTSTGCDVSSEVTDYNMLLIEDNGYEDENAAHPEMDSGGPESISESKVWQSFSFDATFSAAPHAVSGHSSSTAGGKKTGTANMTTTGGDISDELAGADNYWIAVAGGFFNP